MGNKLCKKKTDGALDNPKSPTPFDRIINRLHLRPNAWKSESHLNQKQVNRLKSSKDAKLAENQLLSKSSDWTDASLEVPETDEAIHLRNPKLSLIFDNEDKTKPTPPPRKHKKGFREKIEAVAKNGLQAFQKKPVDEAPFVKKIVNPTCPIDEHDCAIHNRNHKHEQKKNQINDTKNESNKNKAESKRRKNLSVVSLPNYSELKLTIATFDDIDKKPEPITHQSIHNSMVSLPGGEPKKITGSTGKLETAMTRCRSFGSLLPQQLRDKLKVRKIPADIESDDSFGGLEDWDLRIIEHYNPKDASLPRPRKPQPINDNVISDIESLIVKDEDLPPPKAPARRSESLLKRINKEAVESAAKRRSQENLIVNTETPTPPPSPPSPEPATLPRITASQLPTEENGVVEHSSLMKILEQYSMKDKQDQMIENESFPSEGESVVNDPISIIKDNQILDKKNVASIEDFLKNEKLHYTDKQYAPIYGNEAKA